MRTENPNQQAEDRGVQHDSETPLPKKPSLLYVISTSLGVLTLIFIAISAYYGLTQG